MQQSGLASVSFVSARYENNSEKLKTEQAPRELSERARIAFSAASGVWSAYSVRNLNFMVVFLFLQSHSVVQKMEKRTFIPQYLSAGGFPFLSASNASLNSECISAIRVPRLRDITRDIQPTYFMSFHLNFFQ
jgi:hypothetical protein